MPCLQEQALRGLGVRRANTLEGATSAALPVMLHSADSGWHTSWCTWLLHHRCHVAMTVRTLARMQGTSCDASFADVCIFCKFGKAIFED